MAQPLFLEEMTPFEINRYLVEKRAVLIPVGAIEPHGDHLPVGTDSMCAVGLCETLSRELGIAIAPPVLYGLLDRMVGHPGAYTLSRTTYCALVEEIFEQLAKAGFRFFVICNGHGPNREPIIEAIRRVVERHRVQFIIVEWYMAAAEYIERLFDTTDIGHGGIAEVAAILHYRPELVHFDRITPESFVTGEPGIMTFPLQKTAVASDTSCLLNPDKEKMREMMILTENQVLDSVKSAYSLFLADNS